MNDVNSGEINKRIIGRSKFAFLTRELEFWKEANFITQEQMRDIRAHYEVSGFFFSRALINLGVALLGAALLSYIAANWMELSRVTKISIILLVYVGSVLAAFLADKRSPILSRGLLLLGSFAYGGGIFLMAQIFHEGGHYTTALLWWIIGITPACALFKDRLQLSLIQVLSIIYLFGSLAESYYSIRDLDSPLLLVLNLFRRETLLVAGVWALWLYTRGRINFNLSILITLSFIFLILGIRENDIVLYVFCFGVVLGLIPCGKYEDINVWGVVLVGVCGLIMTSSSFWRYEYDGLVGLFSFLNHNVLAVCSGILTCAIMVLFIFKGSSLAVFFFCAVILRYFFDRFYDFLPKSLTFAIGGITLVAVGLLIGKFRRIQKNRSVESISEGGNKA